MSDCTSVENIGRYLEGTRRVGLSYYPDEDTGHYHSELLDASGHWLDLLAMLDAAPSVVEDVLKAHGFKFERLMRSGNGVFYTR